MWRGGVSRALSPFLFLSEHGKAFFLSATKGRAEVRCAEHCRQKRSLVRKKRSRPRRPRGESASSALARDRKRPVSPSCRWSLHPMVRAARGQSGIRVSFSIRRSLFASHSRIAGLCEKRTAIDALLVKGAANH